MSALLIFQRDCTCHAFNVLAEGVERQEQFDTLKAMNCDLYQGYLKSKPLPADQLGMEKMM